MHDMNTAGLAGAGKHVLFLVPARLGDTLMLSPALALLKQLKPDFSIDVLAVSPLAASVYQHNPHCDNIYVASEIQSPDDFIQAYDLLVAAHRDYKILELIDQFKKPVFLIEPADQRQAQAQQALNFIQYAFSDTQPKPEPIGYQLFPDTQDQEYAARLLKGGGRFIGLHLGCHGINKKRSLLPWRKQKQHKKLWPLESFICLAKQLEQQHPGYQLVLTGGDNEQHLADAFIKKIPNAINLVGKTNVLQLAAVMQRFSAYVCSDSGTMHVACAMGIPVIALFGPTNVRRTGPYPGAEFRHVIESEDLSELDPQAVLLAIEQLLGHVHSSQI